MAPHHLPLETSTWLYKYRSSSLHRPTTTDHCITDSMYSFRPSRTYQVLEDPVDLNPESHRRENNTQTHLPPKVLAQPSRFGWRNWLISSSFIIFALCFTAMFGLGISTFILAYGQTLYESDPCDAYSWFTINAGFGQFTYDQAKILDACWNTIIGRGSQVLVGWICYKIFGMALLRVAEHRRIPIDLFTAVSIYPLDARTIPKLGRALTTNRGWSARGIAVSIWASLAVAYVISLPTLLDVMTGYISSSQSLLAFSSNNYQLFIYYNCAEYGTDVWNGSYWTFCETFDVGGENYTQLQVLQAWPTLRCTPAKQYSWGFSTGWAWVVIISTMVWLWGMFGLWHDAQKNSLLWRSGRHPGVFRNLLDIANIINDSLGPDTCGYSEAIRKLDLIGFEVVADGDSGHIRLSSDPQGCVALKLPEVKYGRRATRFPLHMSKSSALDHVS
jgi:hypothetical protein